MLFLSYENELNLHLNDRLGLKKRLKIIRKWPILRSQSLELVTIVIVINVVIGRLSGANCLITISEIRPKYSSL